MKGERSKACNLRIAVDGQSWVMSALARNHSLRWNDLTYVPKSRHYINEEIEDIQSNQVALL